MMLTPAHVRSVRAQTRNGFVTLYAVLIILAMTSITFTIAKVGVQEYQIISLGESSQRVQYFAESAFECAIYARVYALQNPSNPTVSCMGTSLNASDVSTYNVGFSSGGCAVIQFLSGGTQARVRGYDKGSATTCPGANARAERTFVVNFN